MMFSLSAEEIEVLRVILPVAATCLAFSLIPALAVGWVLARKEFFGKSLFETCIFLPLVLARCCSPGIFAVTGFGGNGILGKSLRALWTQFCI